MPLSSRSSRSLFSFGRGRKQLAGENRRLAQILRTRPQGSAYFAWSPRDGVLAASRNAASLLAQDSLSTPDDIIFSFAADDAAALEGLWGRLVESGESFTYQGHLAELRRRIQVTGRRVAPPANAIDELHYIVWLYDLQDQQEREATLHETIDTEETKRTQLEAVLRALPFPAWLRDEELALCWCNAAYANAVEHEPEAVIDSQLELLGKHAKDSHKLAKKARDEETLATDEQHVIVAGERRLLRLHECYIPERDQVLGYAMDITDREDITAELARYRGASDELLGALNTGIAIFSGKQELDFYNAAFADLWQLEDSWLNKRPTLSEWLDHLRERRRLPEQADFQNFKRGWLEMFTGLIEPHEDMMHLPDGTGVRLLIVPHPIDGLFMIFEDVTSRLELESSFKTLTAAQRETLDTLDEGLAVFGADGQLKLWNPAYGKLWDLAPEVLERKPHIKDLVPKLEPHFEPQLWATVEATLLNCALQRKAQEGRLQTKDERVIAYNNVMMPDGGILTRFIDITDSLRVEAALLEKNAALEEADRLKMDFLANVSYQLRTPLNAMMGFAEVLKQQYFGALNERQEEYTDGMIEAGRTLINLVNDILDLSTIEAGYMELNKAPIDVKAMLGSLYEITLEWTRKENLQLKLDCTADIGTFTADETRLKQGLLNLISNAIRFTPEGGIITLSARRNDHGLTIAVSDTGEGIPDDKLEDVLNPFTQIKDKNHNKGAGLGLTLTKSIVELHGGELQIDSKSGKGTSVACVFSG